MVYIWLEEGPGVIWAVLIVTVTLGCGMAVCVAQVGVRALIDYLFVMVKWLLSPFFWPMDLAKWLLRTCFGGAPEVQKPEQV